MSVSADRPRQKANPWLNGALLLLFTLGSVWVADLVFRAYERNYLLPHYPEISSEAPVDLARLSYNDGVVLRQTAEDEFRILSFGDSFTYSVMEPALSFNGIVQQQLDDALEERTVRVVNLGEPGTGPNSFRLASEYWAQVFQHQAVLFHIFLGNDVQDDAYLQSPLVWEPNVAVLQASNAFLDAGSKRVPNRFPLRMLDYAWAAWLSRRTTSAAELPPGYNWAALTELDDDAFADTYFRFMDVLDRDRLPALLPGYEQVLRLLQQAQRLSEKGLKVAVVLGPSEPMVNDELRAEILGIAGADPADYELGLPARIIRMLQQQAAPDVPMLDLTEAFRARHQASGEKLYFRQNTHWDQAGNQLAGDEISGFLLERWFGTSPADNPLNMDTSLASGSVPESAPESEPDSGPELQRISDKELKAYLQTLFRAPQKNLPEVTGAARVMQLFDGVVDGADNWAMAELGQAIELHWQQPLKLSRLRIFLHDDDGRSYGLLLEALVDGQWQVLADRTANPVVGELDIPLPGTAVQALRLTGTSNSKQAENPDNHYIHLEELEWFE
jgi:hypothetical protein